MAKSPTKTATKPADQKILVAAHELRAGSVVLDQGAELTDEIRKEIGLKDEDVADLIERGAVLEITARTAASADGSALAAANARIAELTAEVEQLKADLDKATKPAPAA